MNWSDETVERVAEQIAINLNLRFPEDADGEPCNFDFICAKAALAAVAECSEVKAMQAELKAEQKTTDLYHDNWKAAERKYKAALREAREAFDGIANTLCDAAQYLDDDLVKHAREAAEKALTTINTILGEV